MTPREFLEAFLRWRRLEGRIDGRPLYAYRCTDDEYDRLTEVLREQGDLGLRRRDDDLAALFCLFASEWFSRNYESGPWRWSGALAEIGLETIGYPLVYRTVERGLDVWGRELEVQKGRRLYLATIACEGGLPLGLVRRPGTKLRRFFRALLREIALFSGGDSSSSFEAAAEIGRRFLPRSLRQEVFFRLAARLSDDILRLQRRLATAQLEKAADPLVALDDLDPRWRHNLPLDLDDDTARALLRGLVRDASRVRRERPGWRIVEVLEGERRVFRLTRYLDLSSQCSEQAFRTFFDLPEDERLPDILQLYLLRDDRDPFNVATLTRLRRGTYWVEQRGAPEPVQTGDRLGELLLVAEGRDERFGPVTLSAGHSNDMPWLFTAGSDDDDDLRFDFVGSGSVSVTGSNVVVCLPPDRRPMADPGAVLDDLGVLPSRDRGDRRVVRLCGSLTIETTQGRCRIHTGARETDVATYRLRGKETTFGLLPSPVFVGSPAFEVRCAPGRPFQRVPLAEIEWRPRSGGDWTRLASSHIRPWGDVEFRHAPRGELRAVERAVVLPTDLTLRVESGVDIGRIIVGGAVEARLGADRLPSSVAWCLRPRPGGHEMTLTGLEAVPVDAPPWSLVIDFPRAGRAFLSLPLPRRCAVFCDYSGRPLAEKSTVAVDRLHGCTARVLSDDRSLFWVQGTFDVDDGNRSFQTALHPLRATRTGWYEVSLGPLTDEVKILLGLARHVDDRVTLCLEGSDASPDMRRRLDVSTFEGVLVPDKNRGIVALSDDAPAVLRRDAAEGRLRVEARSLRAPADDPEALVELERCGATSWRFDTAGRRPGPWIVLAIEGDTCRLRPLRWTVDPGDAPADDLDELGRLLEIPDDRERDKKLADLYRSLADRPDDSRWDAIEQHDLRFDDVPPLAMSALRVFARVPRAAVLFVGRLTDQPARRFLRSLPNLAFAWFLTPLDAWLQVLDHRRRALEAFVDKGLAPRHVRSGTESLLDRIQHDVLITDLLRQIVSEWFGEPIMTPPFPQVAQHFSDDLDRRLSSVTGRHSGDETWPDHDAFVRWGEAFPWLSPALRRLWPTAEGNRASYRTSVLRAPLVAAAASILGAPLSPSHIVTIRLMRAFDRTWFDEAYKTFASLCWAFLREGGGGE